MDIPKSQLGFLEFVVKPLFQAWCDATSTTFLMDAFEANKQFWTSQQIRDVRIISGIENMKSQVSIAAKKPAVSFGLSPISTTPINTNLPSRENAASPPPGLSVSNSVICASTASLTPSVAPTLSPAVSEIVLED
eukprot:TRINITY_DN43837_c0_g1_i1.p1 TRINITY_DN43837_c0_g1~~TRINITY_DN43837_c0_g1_i1.p1  ORF type:complete len:152 (+),score=4.80 TRINITY_DN43837_c0_g1_i1:53-457(+)